tara:strand:+ start:5468 stop:5665 length:198 start_codon:yes stop_codon:yes gene_type:complete
LLIKNLGVTKFTFARIEPNPIATTNAVKIHNPRGGNENSGAKTKGRVAKILQNNAKNGPGANHDP